MFICNIFRTFIAMFKVTLDSSYSVRYMLLNIKSRITIFLSIRNIKLGVYLCCDSFRMDEIRPTTHSLCSNISLEKRAIKPLQLNDPDLSQNFNSYSN